RPPRTALQPGNLVAQRRNHSLQLDHLFPLLHNQALQLGVRQTVKIPGRRHSQNESDSRPPENRKIIPPLVLPLLRTETDVSFSIASGGGERDSRDRLGVTDGEERLRFDGGHEFWTVRSRISD